MAITFIEERKKQQKLIWILVTVVLIAALVVWYGFLRKPSFAPSGGLVPASQNRAAIDFKILDSPILKELQPFEVIKPFEGQTGRENPFLPY